ncbi:DUF3027 domain-containing protein [Bifidobacterium jacchi]|uniref:DUF3027 domain-containing protein n=1 Tax=Bifidobacterium jacchi TaxID=2490545 RepID=A0A5N5RF60_9BIFI|nr:DUF3027 domain-containing protein [Bifidobacterium jacchi]KAB5605898.1 DUF3027 domain-containing protein [Bifidobacterium jacchi]
MLDTTLDPQSIAHAVAVESADEPGQVGEFAQAIELGNGVTDFRFDCLAQGYEGWQWSVTLYHDVEVGRWTVNESSLLPTDKALRPPAWIPWKDRLEPGDLAVTDSIGTDPDDPRIEDGVSPESAEAALHKAESEDSERAESEHAAQSAESAASAAPNVAVAADASVSTDADDPAAEVAAAAAVAGAADPTVADASAAPTAGEATADGIDSAADIVEAVQEFALTRRHVLSPLGQAQAVKRWYEGPRGPKSLSTKTASGNVCENCGFFIPIKGSIGTMFGVCANKWSPDDGRVVSLDHGCGEHSEIEPPEPSHLWNQSKLAYDDMHVEIVATPKRRDDDAKAASASLSAPNGGGRRGRRRAGIIVLKSQLPE